MTIIEIVSKILLPIALIIVMFGMGLPLKTDDFKRVIIFPKAGILGLFGQLILLPVIAFIFIWLFPMPQEIAIGVIILSACPGGIVSNIIVFSGKADTALSVTLTAINSFITVFTIPFIVQAGLIFVLGKGEAPDLPVLKLMGMLFSLTILPIGLGMILGHKKPNLGISSEPFFRKLGTILIILFIVFAVLGEIDFVMENLVAVAPLSLLFNLVMMTIGLLLVNVFSLKLLQKITIAVEIGVQNTTLAFLIAFTILNNRQYMIFAAFYGIFMMFTAFGFTTYMRKTRIERQNRINHGQ